MREENEEKRFLKAADQDHASFCFVKRLMACIMNDKAA